MNTVLVCDDDRDIVAALKIYLTSDGYNVLTAYNGKEAIDIVKNSKVHLILMDIMMPGTDGITALLKIRETNNVPVIFTTAKSEDNDIILGLNLGADDYITKPFNPVELLARVRSQIRRYTSLGSAVTENSIKVGGIEINDGEKRVFVDGDEVSLTPTEYDILLLLARSPGQVFSPTEIYRKVWDDEPFSSDSTVAVHIRHLREKIEIDPAKPRYVKVVWGQGYKMEK
ncbi:MAG: response regulator transcription factor [Oscillospiraceae bacterium]|nr:response regulator transcription factor [Oscillospiraceae bacterium]